MRSIKQFISDIINEAKNDRVTGVFIPKTAKEMIDWLKETDSIKMSDGKPYSFDADGYLSEKNIETLFTVMQRKMSKLGLDKSGKSKIYPFVCLVRSRIGQKGEKLVKQFVIRRMYETYVVQNSSFKGLLNTRLHKGGWGGFHDTSYNDAGERSYNQGTEYEYDEINDIVELCRWIKKVMVSLELPKLSVENFNTGLNKLSEIERKYNDSEDDGTNNPDMIDDIDFSSSEMRKLRNDFNRLYPLYDSGALDDLIEDIDNDDIDLNDYIVNTGGSNTHRNRHGQILNKSTCELAVTKDTLEDVLKESGSIISDITLKHKTGDPTYLSIKLKKAQQSSISVMAFRRDVNLNNIIETLKTSGTQINSVKWGDNSTEENLNGPDIVINPETCKRTFNLCNLLGIDIENYVLHCLGLNRKGIWSYESTIPSNSEGEKNIGYLFLAIIGGNYWYVKEDSNIIYMPYDYSNIKCRFDPENYKFTSPAGEGASNIKVKGTLYLSGKPIRAEIVLRSSGSDECRIIPIVNTHDLYDEVEKIKAFKKSNNN